MKKSAAIIKALIGCLVLGALLGAGAGCWVKKKTGTRMQADIVALQTEFEVIRKAHSAEKAALAARLNEADKRIAELNLIIGEYRRVTGRNAADFGVEIEQVKRHVTEMRGLVEVNEHRLGVIEKRLRIIHSDLSDQRVEVHQREEDRLAAEAEAAKKAEAERAKQLPDIVRPEKKEAFYKLAHGLIEAGQTRAARILFDEFLEKWPKDDYSDNALYWIGESFYAEKNYRKAALTFQRVRKDFKRGDKAPDSLLKLGYCFYAMEMYREALPFLKEFVQSYPRKKSLVKKAKEKIRAVKKKLK
jgi:tol-pal system protein YbgF